MVELSDRQRDILTKISVEPEFCPLSDPGDWGDADHKYLEGCGLIRWAKPPHSTIEWEITDAGRSELSRSDSNAQS